MTRLRPGVYARDIRVMDRKDPFYPPAPIGDLDTGVRFVLDGESYLDVSLDRRSGELVLHASGRGTERLLFAPVTTNGARLRVELRFRDDPGQAPEPGGPTMTRLPKVGFADLPIGTRIRVLRGPNRGGPYTVSGYDGGGWAFLEDTDGRPVLNVPIMEMYRGISWEEAADG